MKNQNIAAAAVIAAVLCLVMAFRYYANAPEKTTPEETQAVTETAAAPAAEPETTAPQPAVTTVPTEPEPAPANSQSAGAAQAAVSNDPVVLPEEQLTADSGSAGGEVNEDGLVVDDDGSVWTPAY